MPTQPTSTINDSRQQGFQLFADKPDVISVKQAAQALGLSESTIRRKTITGELRSVKVGTRTLITKTAMLEFLGEGVI